MTKAKSSKAARERFYAQRRATNAAAQFRAKERKRLEMLQREIDSAVHKVNGISNLDTLAKLISRWDFNQLPETVQRTATERFLELRGL